MSNENGKNGTAAWGTIGKAIRSPIAVVVFGAFLLGGFVWQVRAMVAAQQETNIKIEKVLDRLEDQERRLQRAEVRMQMYHENRGEVKP